MPNQQVDLDDARLRPGYVGWRGELLAELALARVPGLIVNRRPDRAESRFGYDFLVATERGLCFFVEVKAFSSFRLRATHAAPDGDWRWHLDAKTVRDAHESRSSYLLFLFDADTEQGRYLRLDTLPAPAGDEGRVTLLLPTDHAITRENLEALIAALEAEQPQRVGDAH
jgi:hypothetical protein